MAWGKDNRQRAYRTERESFARIRSFGQDPVTGDPEPPKREEVFEQRALRGERTAPDRAVAGGVVRDTAVERTIDAAGLKPGGAVAVGENAEMLKRLVIALSALIVAATPVIASVPSNITQKVTGISFRRPP